MIKTAFTELLGIDHPIVQAGMTAGTAAPLAVAVSEAGGLGSLSASMRPPAEFEMQIARIKDLTARPYALNFLVPMTNPESFELGLAARPRVVTLAVGQDDEMVRRCHDAGALVMQQVNTVAQAERAVEGGADILVAQGGESGGFGGFVSTLALVPQVVDAVRPVPVLAAGGIYDGRGLAAALMLGAAGVNIGTRFLACRESPASEEWQRGIIAAASEEPEKYEFLSKLIPPAPNAYYVTPRALKTEYLERWAGVPDERFNEVADEAMAIGQAGRIAEAIPFAGQTAGAINDVKSAAEIIESMVAEAEAALGGASAFVSR